MRSVVASAAPQTTHRRSPTGYAPAPADAPRAAHAISASTHAAARWCGGLSGKADEAFHLRNTAIDNQVGGGDPEATSFSAEPPDMKIAACYPADCVVSACSGTDCSLVGVAYSAQTNKNSTTAGNVGRMDSGSNVLSSLPGLVEKNVDLEDAANSYLTPSTLFRDFDNLDFRPLAGGPLVGSGVTLASEPLDADVLQATATWSVGLTADVGAYDSNASVYWIPGRQTWAATSPVPPNGASGVRPDADLMFLGGLDATSHRIYVGSTYKATLTAPANIYTPSDKFVPGVTYLWRVDAVSADGTTHEGETYTFTAGCADIDCNACGAATLTGSCTECAAGLVLAEGTCVPEGGCLSGSWTLTATPDSTAQDVHVVRTSPLSSHYTDTFAMGYVAQAASSFCGQKDPPENMNAVMNTTGGTSVVLDSTGMGCTNVNYALVSTWECSVCASGYHHEPNEPSKCTLPKPPSPPSPPHVPPPHSPPPPPPNCRETCATNNRDWSTKCGWRVACSGCPECASLG